MEIWDVYGQLGKILKVLEGGKRRAAKHPLPGHTLYHAYVSPPSRRARLETYKLGFDLPFKEAWLDSAAWQELVKQGGKDQVPCLRIEAGGSTRWMYESADIIAYLKSKA